MSARINAGRQVRPCPVRRPAASDSSIARPLLAREGGVLRPGLAGADVGDEFLAFLQFLADQFGVRAVGNARADPRQLHLFVDVEIDASAADDGRKRAEQRIDRLARGGGHRDGSRLIGPALPGPTLLVGAGAAGTLPVAEPLLHLRPFFGRHVGHPFLEPRACLRIHGPAALAAASALAARSSDSRISRGLLGLTALRPGLNLRSGNGGRGAGPACGCTRRSLCLGRLTLVGALASRLPTSALVALSARPVAAAASLLRHLRRQRLIQGQEHLGRRAESDGGVRHAERVRAPGNLNRHVGGHARLELELGIGHVDDRDVGHDVLDDDRLQADLPHLAHEVLGRDKRRPGTARSGRAGSCPRRPRRRSPAPASWSGRLRSGTASAPTCWPPRSGPHRRCAESRCRRSAP